MTTHLTFQNGKELQLHNIQKTCEDFTSNVVATVNFLMEQNKRLYDENENLRNEHYKDTTLIQMQAEVEIMKKNLQRGFPLSEAENNDIIAWQHMHLKAKHTGESVGAAGGRFTYCFTPTALGTIAEVKCSCGAEYCFKEIL